MVAETPPHCRNGGRTRASPANEARRRSAWALPTRTRSPGRCAACRRRPNRGAGGRRAALGGGRGLVAAASHRRGRAIRRRPCRRRASVRRSSRRAAHMRFRIRAPPLTAARHAVERLEIVGSLCTKRVLQTDVRSCCDAAKIIPIGCLYVPVMYVTISLRHRYMEWLASTHSSRRTTCRHKFLPSSRPSVLP
jgi:hypothetical protein